MNARIKFTEFLLTILSDQKSTLPGQTEFRNGFDRTQSATWQRRKYTNYKLFEQPFIRVVLHNAYRATFFHPQREKRWEKESKERGTGCVWPYHTMIRDKKP